MAETGSARWLRARGRRAGVALRFAAGGLAALGQAPFHLPVLSLAGLVAAFALFAAARGWREAAWTGWIIGTGYFVVALHWIVEPFFVDPWRHAILAPFALIFLTGGLGLFWAAAFAAAQAARAGSAGLVIALTGAEMLRAYAFTGFPWATLSHGWVNAAPGQLAALIGSHGLTALMLLLAALLWAVTQRGRVVAGAAFLAAALVSHWPLSSTLSMIPAVTGQGDADPRPVVRLVQPNAPQRQKWDPAHMATFFDRAMTATAAAPRPDLIVWPETSVPVILNQAERVLEAIAEAGGGTPVLAGIQRFDGPRLFNSAILITPGGEVGALYDKHHLVPFGEYLPMGDLLARFGLYGLAAEDGYGYSAGPGARLMELGALGRALPLICYEAVFAQDVGAAPERPDMLIQLTNDAWFGRFSGPFQHLAQARMRAIEQGLPMLRAANTGVSAVIDGRGRITGQLGLGQSGHIDAALPEVLPVTLYSRSGDLPLALLLALLGAGLALSRRRKTD